MPEGIRINQITAGHAKEFHEKLKARGMATTTIHKRIQFARQFMHDAVDWKIIDENPFLKVKTQKSSVKVNEFVPREVVDKLMKKANPVWKVILGLSRYGGLRTPSETLSLRWEDIDWEMNRMSIPEPKVEHHEGRGIRTCPIFPELRRTVTRASEPAAVSSGRQHGDGLEELESAHRNDATPATRRRFGLATIVPLNTG